MAWEPSPEIKELYDKLMSESIEDRLKKLQTKIRDKERIFNLKKELLEEDKELRKQIRGTNKEYRRQIKELHKELKKAKGDEIVPIIKNIIELEKQIK